MLDIAAQTLGYLACIACAAFVVWAALSGELDINDDDL